MSTCCLQFCFGSVVSKKSRKRGHTSSVCKMCQSDTLPLERYKCEYCPKTGPSISPLFLVKYVFRCVFVVLMCVLWMDICKSQCSACLWFRASDHSTLSHGRGSTSKWGHGSCCQWVPELYFDESFEIVGTVSKDRKRLLCSICNVKVCAEVLACNGQYSCALCLLEHAVCVAMQIGAPIQCSVSSCRAEFHATCGYLRGYVSFAECVEDEESWVRVRVAATFAVWFVLCKAAMILLCAGRNCGDV